VKVNYLNTLRRLFVDEAAQRLYVHIPNSHLSDPLPAADFEPDASYLRLWLNDMYLARRRVLYQTRYPMVHAYCNFLYRGQMEEVPLIVGPSQIEGLSAATDRVLNLNYRLIGPIPFRGGEVEILLGLFALEAAEYGSQLLDMLGAISEATGRGEFRLGLQLLGLLKRGVEALFGLNKVKPQLGIHDTFTAVPSGPHQLRPGYRVVMDVTAGQVEPEQLWIKNGRLFHGQNMAHATPFEGADYFLFYIEKMDRRDDFSSLETIHAAWEEVIAKAWQASDEESELAYTTFKGAVLASPDLIWKDQVRLIETLTKKVRQIYRLRARRQFTTIIETGIDASLDEANDIDKLERSRADLLRLSLKE
jgi:hypothetical protein